MMYTLVATEKMNMTGGRIMMLTSGGNGCAHHWTALSSINGDVSQSAGIVCHKMHANY